MSLRFDLERAIQKDMQFLVSPMRMSRSAKQSLSSQSGKKSCDFVVANDGNARSGSTTKSFSPFSESQCLPNPLSALAGCSVSAVGISPKTSIASRFKLTTPLMNASLSFSCEIGYRSVCTFLKKQGFSAFAISELAAVIGADAVAHSTVSRRLKETRWTAGQDKSAESWSEILLTKQLWLCLRTIDSRRWEAWRSQCQFRHARFINNSQILCSLR
jgi:hypothetical protein